MDELMTRPSLADIEKRAAEATGGPWEDFLLFSESGKPMRYEVAPASDSEHEVAQLSLAHEGDAAFIADARTAVPALTAAVRDVLALHQPYTIWAYDDVNGVWIYDEHGEHVVVAIVCRECTPATSMSLLGDCEWTIDHPVVEHPCPTVRALATRLDLTDLEGDPT